VISREESAAQKAGPADHCTTPDEIPARQGGFAGADAVYLRSGA